MGKCGFKPREIHSFGSGQGASTSLHPSLMSLELGSIIAIDGLLPLSTPVSLAKYRAPLLLLGGTSGGLAEDSGSGVKRTKDTFEFVETHPWKGDDGMPKNQDKALPMMDFFARRLRTGQGWAEGGVEIG